MGTGPRGAPGCSGHQSNVLGGAALLGVPCIAISDSQPRRKADRRVPTPEGYKRQGVAEHHHSKWSLGSAPGAARREPCKWHL